MRKPLFHKSFLNAFRGVFLIMKSERNFRIELLAFAVNVVLIFYFRLSSYDTALILLVSFAVLAAEMLNTSIENVCDMVHPEFDKRIGFIKDVAAGAVLLMAIASVVVGIMVYGKYLVNAFLILQFT